ncbi:GAF domain-containing protein [Actinoplanes oblitus]|uniref:GAF domain-containing protein n=1 Tax=Actinoplanes oblitus TaxID=3040509 RepID=A0ABY8WUL9_9ACTN|nr:GAF domain-containing protein [Actinoplanes oblitus]WIN00095.1 GAF domain-containing protein [Actinoplanes oblitus]
MNLSTDPTGMINAADRIRILASIDLDSPALHAELDALAAATAQHTGMPTGMASIVLGMAQVAAGSYGLTGILAEAGGTPVEWALCSRVVTSGRPYIVPDTTLHPVESRNPLVTMDGLRAYAGYPVAVAGQIVGAICVLADTPHHFTDDQLVVLQQAADVMADALQRHRNIVAS